MVRTVTEHSLTGYSGFIDGGHEQDAKDDPLMGRRQLARCSSTFIAQNNIARNMFSVAFRCHFPISGTPGEERTGPVVAHPQTPDSSGISANACPAKSLAAPRKQRQVSWGRYLLWIKKAAWMPRQAAVPYGFPRDGANASRGRMIADQKL
jgi:hypothetical protein